MFCTQCGHQNSDDSRFCARCGAELRGHPAESGSEQTSTLSLAAIEGDHIEEEHDLASPQDALSPGTALLVVKRGPNAGSRFLLDKEITTAGRHPESDIFLDDVTVSRRHAEFRRTGSGFEVRDVGSLNGTYLNRGRIEGTSLSGGDEVQIGKFRLVFFSGPVPVDSGGAS
ncbi:MAG: FHA domain-containing protein [Actinomycetota bacterium]